MFQEVIDIQPDDISLFPPEYEVLISDKKLRNAIFEAFGGKCAYTKRELSRDNFHIDHIIPRSKGGKDNIYNYVLCCPDINATKSGNYDKVGATLALSIVRQVFAPRIIRTMKQMKDESEKKAQVVHETKRQVVQSVDEKLYISKVEEKISEIGELLLSVLKNQTIILANKTGMRIITISFCELGDTMTSVDLFENLLGGQYGSYGSYANTHFGKSETPGFGISTMIKEGDNFSISLILPYHIENRKKLPPVWQKLCDFAEDIEQAEEDGKEILFQFKKHKILNVTEKDGIYEVVFESGTFEIDNETKSILLRAGKSYFSNILDENVVYDGITKIRENGKYVEKIYISSLPTDNMKQIPKSWFAIELLLREHLLTFDS